MLTPATEPRIDGSVFEAFELSQGSVRDRLFAENLPAWWADYPAIWRKIAETEQAFIYTIALFGSGRRAESPDPTLLLKRLPDGLYPNFRGRVAHAYRHSAQQSTATADAIAAVDVQIRRTLDSVDQWRLDRLRQLQRIFVEWGRRVAGVRREDMPSKSDAVLNSCEYALSQLEDTQQALLTAVELFAKIVEDWIVTVRGFTFPSPVEQQQNRDNLLARLRAEFLPASDLGPEARGGIDEGIKAALRVGDVVVIGESMLDTATRRYLTSRMAMLADENVGALLVPVPVDVQPILDRFTNSNRGPLARTQLRTDLQSAGVGGGEAFADMLYAAADHNIRVVAFDTRLGQTAEQLATKAGVTQRLQVANPYMAAVVKQTLDELPDDKKNVVGLVPLLHTATARENSDGGVDALTDGVSFDEHSRVFLQGVALSPGDVIYHPKTENAWDNNDSIFVFEPLR